MVTIVDAVVPVPVIIECDAHVWHSYFNAPDAMTCAVCLFSLMYVQCRCRGLFKSVNSILMHIHIQSTIPMYVHWNCALNVNVHQNAIF